MQYQTITKEDMLQVKNIEQSFDSGYDSFGKALLLLLKSQIINKNSEAKQTAKFFLNFPYKRAT